MIGYALCGSFCTHAASIAALEVIALKYKVQPIISDAVYYTDTRFGTAAALYEKLSAICGTAPIYTVKDAEPFGPSVPLEALVVAPCTGNTAAKIAHGITDTAVTMAVKATLRSDRPLVLAIASNDALGSNFANIAHLHCRRSIYLVPMRQDDPTGKPNSLVADMTLVPDALEAAIAGKKLQPLFVP